MRVRNPNLSRNPSPDAHTCCEVEQRITLAECVRCQFTINVWEAWNGKSVKIQVEKYLSNPSISGSETGKWNDTITFQTDLQTILAFSHFECAYAQTLKQFFFQNVNVRMTTSSASANENVIKCEVLLHIFENWCTSRSGGGQSTCIYSYTFTFCFAQCITHLLLLHITIMLSDLWKYFYVFSSHNDIHTHLDTSLMLHTLIFYTCAFVDTLGYCIHKHTQMHLIIGSVLAVWSVIFIFVFAAVEEFMKNEESTHKCRCRFEDGARTCGMVSHIHHTCCYSGSEYQSHVIELSTNSCLHKGHEHHQQGTYIFDTLKSLKSSKSHQMEMKVFRLRSRWPMLIS